ncbi:MAG: DNA adenine methylase [Spirochaetales bacterium]|nr:DNA adenine methylase [Spirochaetales bacterium]
MFKDRYDTIPGVNQLRIQGEDPAYLRQQLVTYIGNKRALLDFIGKGVRIAAERLSKTKLKVFDVFSGSGIVSRYFKQYAELLLVNDIEPYSQTINRCYLTNRSDISFKSLASIHTDLLSRLETLPLRKGFITELYAPKNDECIKPGERVFYTNRNARYIDTARQYIGETDEDVRHFFIAPLLSEASIHANTAGVFKGFYKNAKNGIGRFGGTKGDALRRIKGAIGLPFPVFSRHECEVIIHLSDANALAPMVEEVDIAYVDPPYNQHPYGSNYFMLNLITSYRRPAKTSEVSGIPVFWKRSDYNKAHRAASALRDLLFTLKAKYILVSFNSEGFTGKDEMTSMLEKIGKVETLETTYNTFRGSRNLRNRDIHVKEYLYLVEKK